jgi:hypothetical protein
MWGQNDNFFLSDMVSQRLRSCLTPAYIIFHPQSIALTRFSIDRPTARLENVNCEAANGHVLE